MVAYACIYSIYLYILYILVYTSIYNLIQVYAKNILSSMVYESDTSIMMYCSNLRSQRFSYRGTVLCCFRINWYLSNAHYNVLPGLTWKNQYIPSLRNTVLRIGQTSIYRYIHSRYTVHHQTSFGIRFYPPCAADESPVHAGGLHPCELSFFLQSPQLTDHPGVACHVQVATATD